MPTFTPLDAAQFINAQKTRAYKVAAYEFFKQKHGSKFALELRGKLKVMKDDGKKSSP